LPHPELGRCHVTDKGRRYTPVHAAPESIPDERIVSGWIALAFAGAFEVVWALGLKYSDGFSRFWPSLGTLAALLLSFGFLGISLQTVPFGTAYAVWCGLGAAGVALAGIVLFGETATLVRLFCLFLIIAGTVGLKLSFAD
jgi:quaternary ammonium compound-resistance protein SugE